jgi:hypothetical protein
MDFQRTEPDLTGPLSKARQQLEGTTGDPAPGQSYH